MLFRSDSDGYADVIHTTVDFNLALAPGVENAVYVLVAQPDGTPLEGATVTATSPQAQGELRAATDALGVATLHFATAEVGQGFVTLAGQIARSVLGVEQVVLEPIDTRIGSSGSTSASRQTWMSGGAVDLACRTATRLPRADALIAAAAKSRGARLVHRFCACT